MSFLTGLTDTGFECERRMCELGVWGGMRRLSFRMDRKYVSEALESHHLDSRVLKEWSHVKMPERGCHGMLR